VTGFGKGYERAYVARWRNNADAAGDAVAKTGVQILNDKIGPNYGDQLGSVTGTLRNTNRVLQRQPVR
jgi:hypothetical protein